MTDKGGKITHEFSLIKGFTYVHLDSVSLDLFTKYHGSAEFPDDSVQTLETNEHVTVEADSVAKTQRAE